LYGPKSVPHGGRLIDQFDLVPDHPYLKGDLIRAAFGPEDEVKLSIGIENPIPMAR
jgi:hypothetical protein